MRIFRKLTSAVTTRPTADSHSSEDSRARVDQHLAEARRLEDEFRIALRNRDMRRARMLTKQWKHTVRAAEKTDPAYAGPLLRAERDADLNAQLKALRGV
ncbi:hypothetical protein [Streptomyces sp. PA5.6]|uniref:hypothetical protein n=1 Tax=Streptomyces sp. PA5.6 TaxID=3035651 RepID=UPI003904A882